MDIKDSYLHGTVGVVKSISVSADKLSYKLADVYGTVQEVTLPTATQTANGLMSSGDKAILDNLSTNYVTVNTDQDISGIKTFTAAKGTAPFLVTSDTKVENLYSDKAMKLYAWAFDIEDANAIAPTDNSMYYYSSTSNATKNVPITNEWQNGLVAFPLHHNGVTAQLYFSKDKKPYFRSNHISNWNELAYVSEIPTKTSLLTNDSDFVTGGPYLPLTGGIMNGEIAFDLYRLPFKDISAGILAAFKAPRIQANELIANYIYLGSNNGSGGSSSSDSPLVIRKYGSVSYLSPATITDLVTINTDGSVLATKFQGNLDGTYVNALTRYSKAESAEDLTATDTLNEALGKLEYKADTAYAWIISVTTEDTDNYINKWGEIVEFLNSVEEDTDILDEFVTRKTDLIITGLKTFLNKINIKTTESNKTPRLVFDEYYSSPSWVSEIVSDYYGTNICKTEHFTHGLFITLGRLGFDNLNILNSNKIPIARISKEKGHYFDGTVQITENVTAAKFITSGGIASLFVKGDGSLDGNTYISTKDVTLELLGINKVLFERFSRDSSVETNAITEKDLIGKTLIDAVLINDFGSYDVGDNYFARLTTYLYFSANTEWTTTGYSDDGSTIYLNDTIIVSLPTCISTPITLNFVKGWNKLVWVFNENAGNDAAYFGSSIKSVSNLVYMNAYPISVPTNTWRPVSINGNSIATSATDTGILNLNSGTGISVSGTTVNDITITNAGVRSVTIGTGTNSDKLAVNTNGTITYLTVPYATLASTVTCTEISGNTDRPIVLTNQLNGLYYTSKATINYAYGHLKTEGNIESAKFTLTSPGTSDFSAGTIKCKTLSILASDGGTTYSTGKAGLVLKSNGSSVYWSSNSGSDTWRAILTNGTLLAGTGTNTYALNFKSGSGISIVGTKGSSSTNNEILITNTGMIGYDGSKHYRLLFALGETDLAWKKIVEVKSSYTTAPEEAAWEAVTIRGTIWYSKTNYSGNELIKIPFCAVFKYVEDTSLLNTVDLYLPRFAKEYPCIRIVRRSTNRFELQVSQIAENLVGWIDYQVSGGGTINAYTSLQSAYSGTVVKLASNASDLIEDRAYCVYDYNNTNTPIYIGFAGAGLETTLYFAAYGTTSTGEQCIKDISIAKTKEVLGIGKTIGDSFTPIYLNNGTFLACTYKAYGDVIWKSPSLGYIQVLLFGPIVVLLGYITNCVTTITSGSSSSYIFKLPQGVPTPYMQLFGITLTQKGAYNTDRNTIIRINAGGYAYCDPNYNAVNPNGTRFYFSACYVG